MLSHYQLLHLEHAEMSNLIATSISYVHCVCQQLSTPLVHTSEHTSSHCTAFICTILDTFKYVMLIQSVPHGAGRRNWPCTLTSHPLGCVQLT